jgi:tripartite-type tricarboxylate transporter receptor subunit TctC
MTRLIKSGLVALSLACTCAGMALAQTQTYPNKPIFFVVGPGPDALARFVGQRLTEAWGQQVLVDIQPAAGGVIAERRVASAPPDGYTMLLTTGSYSINEALRPSLPVKILRDLEPVALIGTLSFVLVTSPSHPAKSLAEMIKLAASKPGALNCASSGVGTTAHLGCEMLKQAAKVDFGHVPYRGAASALVDIMGGRVDFTFSVPTVVPQIKAGELRALAISGPQRLAALPDVPTLAELGYPEAEFQSWNGVHVPRGTPKAVIEKLNTEIDKFVNTPQMHQRMEDFGFESGHGTPEQFGAFVKNDMERWNSVVKTTGVKLED